jgi:general secretion pathway protein J
MKSHRTFRKSRSGAGRGFTLVEVLIALAIISIALLASLRLAGSSTSSVAELRGHLLAGWVAENVLAEQRARGTWLPLGIQRGTESQGGKEFAWREDVTLSPNSAFRRVDLRVFAAAEEDHVLAHWLPGATTGFREMIMASHRFVRMGHEVRGVRGFTLIELLSALMILSLLALISYRGLSAVLDSRQHVGQESEKWRKISHFLERFESDAHLAAPRAVRSAGADVPAWLGQAGDASRPQLEFSRFASAEGIDAPRRLAYRLNAQQEIELWLWPGLDMTPAALPVHYPVLAGVNKFELDYLNANLQWVAVWPKAPDDAPIPRAVRLRIELASGEAIVRVIALNS